MSGALHFTDRREAGCRLAAELKARSIEGGLVLALPRGGVPVGYEIARALGAPLDVLLVRKIGAPGMDEFAIGAVIDGAAQQTVLDSDTIRMLHVTPAYVAQERERQLVEIERRRRLYCGSSAALPVAGRTVIVVDDGVATGASMHVALKALQQVARKRCIVAVPVAAADALQKLAVEADEVVCLSAPPDFRAVGLYYADFSQTSDEEVIELLSRRRAELAAAGEVGAG